MAVFVGLILVAQPGLSWAEDFNSGNYYISACSEALKDTSDPSVDSSEFNQCMGFIAGARGVLAIWEIAGDPVVCIPTEVLSSFGTE